MRVERVPIPAPRPTDVLVAVKACGIVPNLINVPAYPSHLLLPVIPAAD